MANLDIPTSDTFFKKTRQGAEYESPSKAFSTQAYLSKSPLTSESRNLSSYYELKNSLEQRYQSDLDRWRAKAEESDLRRDIIEKENNRLAEELLYWKNRAVTVNKEKAIDIEIQSQLSRSRVDILTRSTGAQQNLLNVEIDSLRNQLHEKMKEVEEWKRIYFEQELKSSGVRSTTENQMRNYEAQLSLLLGDIQSKIDQQNTLERDNTELSLSTARLGSVQKEVRDIKTLLGLKLEESEKLKEEVTKSQIENINLRKSELSLKDREALLFSQIDSIKNKIENTRQLQNLEQDAADRANLQLLEALKNDHEQAKNDLERRKNSVSNLIEEKSQQIDDLQSNLEQVKQSIGLTRLQKGSAKKDADSWKERHKSIEREREEEVSRIYGEREKSVENLKKSFHYEKEIIEGKIDNLRTDLTTKDQLLQQTAQQLQRSRVEKAALELEKRQLLSQVELKRLQEEEQERNHRIRLEARERLHERSKDLVRSNSQYEKQKLAEQEKTLGLVLDSKAREALEAKERANRYLSNSIVAERKEREKSVEAEVWKNQYQRNEREKSIESEVARELRRSQVEQLKRSHGQEILQKELHNSALQSVLASKQGEISSLQQTSNSLVHQLAETQLAAQRANLDAQVWRSQAEVEEREKAIQLLAKESVQKQELEILRRSQIVENSVLRNEISDLLTSVNSKDREAANWRESYNRLYTSNYTK